RASSASIARRSCGATAFAGYGTRGSASGRWNSTTARHCASAGPTCARSRRWPAAERHAALEKRKGTRERMPFDSGGWLGSATALSIAQHLRELDRYVLPCVAIARSLLLARTQVATFVEHADAPGGAVQALLKLSLAFRRGELEIAIGDALYGRSGDGGSDEDRRGANNGSGGGQDRGVPHPYSPYLVASRCR